MNVFTSGIAVTSRPDLLTTLRRAPSHRRSPDLRQGNDEGADLHIGGDGRLDVDQVPVLLLVPDGRENLSLERYATVHQGDREGAVQPDGVPLDEIADEIIHERHAQDPPLGPLNRITLRPYRNCSTTRDFAGSCTVSVSPDTVAPVNGAGRTASGCSNVLCAFIRSAVRIRPETAVTGWPRTETLMVRA